MSPICMSSVRICPSVGGGDVGIGVAIHGYARRATDNGVSFRIAKGSCELRGRMPMAIASSVACVRRRVFLNGSVRL